MMTRVVVTGLVLLSHAASSSAVSHAALFPRRTLAAAVGAGSTTTMVLGKKSTAEDVAAQYGQDLQGKTAVVTGGNSGIGLETVRVLASRGAKVVLCARSVEAGEAEAAKIRAADETAHIVVRQLDLADLTNVQAAGEALAQEDRLDFLVLNAGIAFLPQKQLTTQGFEKQIGVNHFGHHLLVRTLMDKVIESQARVVVLSSTAHGFPGLNLDDLHFENRRYTSIAAYGQSKAANLLYAKALADRLRGTGAVAFSVHPGVINTNLWREGPKAFQDLALRIIADKSTEQGAATTVFACLAPQLERLSGSYLKDCDVATPTTAQCRDADGTLRERLWQVTEEQIAAALSK